MSDRHLCKAKRTDNGEWVVWNVLSGIPHDISISDNTICQCTGLSDRAISAEGRTGMTEQEAREKFKKAR